MIREATMDDMDSILEMGRAFAAAAGVPGFTFDLTTCFKLIEGLITEEGGCLLVAEGDDKSLIGMMGGFAHGALTNRKHVQVSEAAWWVKPEHRGGGVSAKLLLAFVEWAKKINAKEVRLVSLENGSQDAMAELYGKLGAKLVERHYSLTLEG